MVKCLTNSSSGQFKAPGGFMSILYKYMQKEHAKLLIEEGKFRIGTLYEYRDIEKHGEVIGDFEEGKKSTYMAISFETWNPNNQPEFTKDFFNLSGNGSLTISNLTLEKPNDSPNHYLFCTTDIFDKNALADFGYDTCIIIENPKRFFSIISKTLRHKAKYLGAFKCQYQSRRVSYNQDNGAHPAIIKPLKYKSQNEVRGLWLAKKKIIKPIIIQSHRAAKLCNYFKVL